MSKIHMIVAVPDANINPTLVDPEEPADTIVDTYNEWAQVNGAWTAELVSAGWEGQSRGDGRYAEALRIYDAVKRDHHRVLTLPEIQRVINALDAERREAGD